MVKLDPRAAAKGGMPAQIPVPGGEIPEVQKQGIVRERVVPWIERFLAQFPASPLADQLRQSLDKAKLWTRAAGALKGGRWNEAGEALTQILAIDPDDASAHFNLAAVCHQSADAAGALDHFNRSERVFNDEGIFYMNRGRTHQQLGRRKEAVLDFKRALQLIPGDEAALARLAQLGEMVEVYGDPSDPASRAYISREDYAKAARIDMKKIENDFARLIVAAHRYAVEEQPELAREAAGLAAKLKPEDAAPWLYMAVSLWLSERYSDAEHSIRRHLDLDPKSAVGWTNLAKIQAQLGRAADARESAWKAVELDPNQREAIEILLVPADQKGAETIEALKKFADKFPSSWAA